MEGNLAEAAGADDGIVSLVPATHADDVQNGAEDAAMNSEEDNEECGIECEEERGVVSAIEGGLDYLQADDEQAPTEECCFEDGDELAEELAVSSWFVKADGDEAGNGEWECEEEGDDGAAGDIGLGGEITSYGSQSKGRQLGGSHDKRVGDHEH